MMRNSSLLVLEIIWSITGVFSLIISIRILLTTGDSKFLIFALMALVSFLFAWLRHKERKKS